MAPWSPKRVVHNAPLSQRARGTEKHQKEGFVPPEDWHQPGQPTGGGYRIIVQPAGRGFRHVVTAQEIRQRLAQLPSSMLELLEVVQLSRMTRKKRSFPCYGMQWGNAVYLYPIERSLVEYYGRPPKPAQMNEARMFGGRWVHSRSDDWQLVWTESAIKDFYLNNVLIHELGHLLDDRNSNYNDRERFAEWFAIQHGYRASRCGDRAAGPGKKRIVRRHHGQ